MNGTRILKIGNGASFIITRKTNDFFPPKKIKALGWTVNFANPLSISALFLITAIILVLSNYLKKY